MKKYLRDNKPRFTLFLIGLFLVSSILTTYSTYFGEWLLLYPKHVSEPVNWYRFIAYPFYIDGLDVWFLNALSLLLTAFVFENSISRRSMVLIALGAALIGGLVYALLNQQQPLDPIASPMMISWGYIAAALVCGFRNWNKLILFEKIIVGLSLITLLNFFSPNQNGILITQFMVMISIAVGVLLSGKKSKLQNNKHDEIQKSK
jgi:membrane associated rhomboid family serine protease